MDPISLPDSLVTQLRAYEARLRRMETLAAVSCGVVGLLASFVVLFAMDRFVDTPQWLRGIFTLTGGLLPAWIAHRWARYWLWHRRGPAQLAKLLQRHFRTLGDRLQGIIELTESSDLPSNVSPGLLRAAVRQVAEESGRFDFPEAVPVRPARRWALAAVVLVTMAILPFIIAPKAGSNALLRWLAPWEKVDRYTFASFETLPSQMIVAHGEPFEIACRLKANSAWKPQTATARLNRQEPKEARLENGQAVFHLEGQTQDGVLSLRMGDAMHKIDIRPLHRPEMRELAAKVTMPDYLGYPDATVPIPGSTAEFLEGSKVSFQGKVSFSGKVTRKLGHAAMKKGEAEPAAAVSNDSFTTPEWPVSDLAGEAAFRWADSYGLTPAQPYVVRVSATKDAEPRVELQGLETETAILPEEVLRLNLTATDDYGLKDAWLGWTSRSLSEKKEDLAKGEASHALGDHTRRELSAKAEFSPALEKVPEDSVVELAAYALDYFPARKPVRSWKYTVYVLSPAKHAERVRERMDQVLKQLEERIRDEERQMDETKNVAENKKELASDRTTEDLKRIEAGERQNEGQLGKLTEEMGEVMKEALRNKEIPNGTVADWQQLKDLLEKQADPPMQGASQSLQQAGQQPGEREQQLAQTQEQQQKALEAMRKASKQMDTTAQNLYARNFYNRLRAAASAEHQVSDGLKSLVKDTVGLKPEEISEALKKTFNQVAGKQDDNIKDVDKIANDMAEFIKRVPNEKYEAVEKEMQDKKVVSAMNELADYVRANQALRSVTEATRWGDQLDTWASMLQSECHSQGGDGEMDPEQMELIVSLVRAAQAEDNIREATGLLESKKDDAEHVHDARKLSGQQDQLYWMVDEIREKTKFKEVKPTLQAVEGMMQEVTTNLRKPKTDDEVASVEGTIIELLVPPDKKGGNSNSKMQQMMQKMMAQTSRAKTPGGNNSKSGASFSGESAEGAVGQTKANSRNVEKTGAANSAEWPEEFRDQLQAYFQATESAAKESKDK